MIRVKQASDAKNLDVAIRLLNTIIEIRPNYTEAWNRRATLYFLKDYSNSLADLRQVLSREPRHFGALAGLGTIMEELGEEKQALEAFRRAQAVHPRGSRASPTRSRTSRIKSTAGIFDPDLACVSARHANPTG